MLSLRKNGTVTERHHSVHVPKAAFYVYIAPAPSKFNQYHRHANRKLHPLRQRRPRHLRVAYTRVRDGARTWIPVNIIGNLYVSNGMAAGNTMMEAQPGPVGDL